MGWAGIGAENRAREDLYLLRPKVKTMTFYPGKNIMGHGYSLESGTLPLTSALVACPLDPLLFFFCR